MSSRFSKFRVLGLFQTQMNRTMQAQMKWHVKCSRERWSCKLFSTGGTYSSSDPPCRSQSRQGFAHEFVRVVSQILVSEVEKLCRIFTSLEKGPELPHSSHSLKLHVNDMISPTSFKFLPSLKNVDMPVILLAHLRLGCLHVFQKGLENNLLEHTEHCN